MTNEEFRVFLVFAGQDYYPQGGRGDFVGWYYTYEDALARVKRLMFEYTVDWIEINYLGHELSERDMDTLGRYYVKYLFNTAKWSVPGMTEKWRYGPPPGATPQHLGWLLVDSITEERVFISSRTHPTGYCKLAVDR
ncbi:MAG: hypothetical protein AMJ53_16710 [Gammaproteobacteria bacterium SG8_11]|nr:MAG: hypothetical protein AMJ53_16710 [Gammaproteobacteria bacterium SG8_11]